VPFGGLGKKSDFLGIIFIFLLLWGFLDSEFEGTQHRKSVVWWLGPLTYEPVLSPKQLESVQISEDKG